MTYRARYAMPDGQPSTRAPGATKLGSEAWLAAERALIDREGLVDTAPGPEQQIR